MSPSRRGSVVGLAALAGTAVLALVAVLLWPDDAATPDLAPPELPASTDDAAMDGLATVERLDAADGPAPAPQPLDAPLFLASEPTVAPLPPARSVRGRVREAGGRPIAGARVYASWTGGKDLVHSGDDGTFAVDFPPAAERSLRVSRVGYAGTVWLDVERVERELDVALDTLVQLTAQFVDAEGQPAQGVLRAFDAAPESEPFDPATHTLRSSWVRRTGAMSADPRGQLFCTVREGQWTFVTSWRMEDMPAIDELVELPPALRDGVRTYALRGPEARLELELPRLASVGGRVQPARSDVTVSIARPDLEGLAAEHAQAPRPFASTRLDAAGEYAFHDVPPGDWVLAAWSGGDDLPARVPLTLVGGERRRVDLAFDGPRVALRVRDVMTGDLLRDARVALWREPDEPEPGLRPPRPFAGMAQAEIEQDGVRALAPPCDAEGLHDLSDLAPGRYLLWARQQTTSQREDGRRFVSGWYAPVEARWLVVPPPPQAVELELPVTPATRLQVRVEDVPRRHDLRLTLNSRTGAFQASPMEPMRRDGVIDTWTTVAPPGHHEVVVTEGDDDTVFGAWITLITVQPVLGQENLFTLQLPERD